MYETFSLLTIRSVKQVRRYGTNVNIMSAKCTIHWLCDFLHADLLVQGILDLIVCAILGFWEVCSWLYREGAFHTLTDDFYTHLVDDEKTCHY